MMEVFCIDSNVLNVNVFWTNSPSKKHELLKIAVEYSCPIDTFRKKILKLLMDINKFQYDEQEEFDLDSMIEIMTNRGHFLSEKDEYLTVGDFKVGQSQNRVPCVIVQTKKFGLIHHVALKSCSSDSSYSYSSFSLSLPLNLRLDTFATLKSMIREFAAKMSPENSFKFIYRGSYIDLDLDTIDENDNRPILKCLRDNTNIIWYYQNQPYESETFSVFIATPKGELITIGQGQDILPESTIENLKCMIYESAGIPPDEQRLIFSGRQLADGRTLKDYNIEARSILYLVLRLPQRSGCRLRFLISVGGVAVSIPGISFAVDLFDSRNLVQKAYISKAPKWRIVKEGLNIEGICGNTACKAYDQQVIAPRGFKDFQLKNDSQRIKCPICREKLKELCTFGFASTFWRYFGRKRIKAFEPDLLHSDWAEAGNDAYTSFSFGVNEPGGMESWSLLVIQARPVFKDKSEKYPQPSHCGFCFQPIEWVRAQLKRLSCGHIYHKNCTEKSQFCCNFCILKIY